MPGFTLGRVLKDRRDAIIARFVVEIRRKDLPPAGLSSSILIDHIPGFLDEILEELGDGRAVRTSFDALDTSPTARRHGGQRWSVGYDLEALMREYGILRHCILQEVKEAEAPMSVDDFDLLAKCLNVGATEAAAAYVKRRDEELAFLADAGELLTSSLDRMSIVGRLTRLVVPRLADWCAVYVEGVKDASIAHVNVAKAASLRELHHRLSASAATDGPYFRVLHSGEPELGEEAPGGVIESFSPNPEEQALLREVGIRSWTLLPLRVKTETFGLILLAYADSNRRYSRSDLPVLQELASKASIALENARLYELSQKARSRVEAATRAKDEFVAMVSHELRTPLNAILGWLHLRRSGALPPEKRDHVFDVVERNASALNGLVADLLDVSRIITGSIRLNWSLVDFSNVVELALEGVRPALEAKRIHLTLNLEAPHATFRADGERLQQVVWNLLSNAIKFTPKEGSIVVSVRQINSDLELEVRDDGCGIAVDFLPHVFDSFRQWESGSTRRHGGLGIGLSIARYIVELHGGSIAAKSEGPGKGSTFLVHFPMAALAVPSEAAQRVPAARLQKTEFPGGLDGLRVLVVDDEEDALELFRVLLQAAGMDVRTAESAERGVIELQEFQPDVLVSDVAMPGEDGYSLIRRVRTLSSQASGTPAIALTAYARNEDRSRALVEGFNVHLSKPVEPVELLTAIADLSGRPQTPRQP